MVEMTQGGFLTFAATFFIMGFALATKWTLPRVKIKKIFMGPETILHGLIDKSNHLKIDVVKNESAVKRGDNFYSISGSPVTIPGVGSMYLHHWSCISPLDTSNDGIEKAKERLSKEHPEIEFDPEKIQNPKITEKGELVKVTALDILRGLTADNTGLVYRAAKAKGVANSMMETLAAVKMQRNFILLLVIIQVAMFMHLKEIPNEIGLLKEYVVEITNNLAQGQQWGVK